MLYIVPTIQYNKLQLQILCMMLFKTNGEPTIVHVNLPTEVAYYVYMYPQVSL